MRDLVLNLLALMLPARRASPPLGSLAADVPGLVSDVERRCAALEAYCHDVGDVTRSDVEFSRFDGLVTEAVYALRRSAGA